MESLTRDQSAPALPGLVLFTDLDGSLLDADTYRYDAARPALDRLRAHAIPLVICTSKTRAEVECLRKELGNKDPFIVESGGALYVPDGYFKAPMPGSRRRDGCRVIELGVPYPRLREAFRLIKRTVGVDLVGFGDMRVGEIARVTGLAQRDAGRARQREYDEPFLIKGAPMSLESIRQAAQQLGLAVIPGGRFFHLVGCTDKGKACRLLIELYRKEWGPVSTAGIGDSLNDLPMLAIVDRPFLVERPEGGYAEGVALKSLMRLPGVGPTGWNEGVNRLLREFSPYATGSAPAPDADSMIGWYPGSLRDLI